MTEQVTLMPLAIDAGLKDKVFNALRQAVVSMDIYSSADPPRLDERKLAEELGVSRTPIREALSRLEQEGLVRNIPRRGTFVVRKTKIEIIEIIQVWAALESMAARLATEHATDRELADFRVQCAVYLNAQEDGSATVDEYSESNIQFHQNIVELSKNEVLVQTAKRLFVHMHAVRASTIKHPQRTLASVIDHNRIIHALINRETGRVEKLVREHALKLAEHVRKHVDFLD